MLRFELGDGWDALWRLFAWLLDAQEGHSLGSAVVDEFCRHAFGMAFETLKAPLAAYIPNLHCRVRRLSHE